MNVNLSVQLKRSISKIIVVIDVFGNSISSSFRVVFIPVAFKKQENISVKLNKKRCNTGGQHMASLLSSRLTLVRQCLFKCKVKITFLTSHPDAVVYI